MKIRFLDVKMNVIELTNATFDMSYVMGFGFGGIFGIIVYLLWEAWNKRDK
ncbi:hypothetical protein HGO21_00350 [Acinetobacter sp. CUI P1]|jgi:hypothetical protein|nr:hypothetical protein [Acinetobacter sp. CUI P1]